ncbi:hypothetical protein CBL_09321 [Carabus blaptoides fortunei]
MVFVCRSSSGQAPTSSGEKLKHTRKPRVHGVAAQMSHIVVIPLAPWRYQSELCCSSWRPRIDVASSKVASLTGGAEQSGIAVPCGDFALPTRCLYLFSELMFWCIASTRRASCVWYRARCLALYLSRNL